jgi:threonyl-tRNA synthetase
MPTKTTDPIYAIRHSCAHLLAWAVLDYFGPEVKLAIGPVIENGFYYDFDLPREITADDLPKLEKLMKEKIRGNHPFVGQKVSLAQAKKRSANQPYKLDLIQALAEKKEPISYFMVGAFEDLCRGNHVENTREIHPDAIALTHTAGAYWRGNSKNPMLTRIYGVAFQTADERQNYLIKRVEAEKRDHKKLGQELDLFLFSKLVGPGLPLWTPKGTLLRLLLDEFVWQLRSKHGYERVEIPHITKKELYETSGHWDKFKNELFNIKTREDHLFAMKPMNCPHHTQIYARKLWSYRELPQRYANTTMCYRDEQTGELSGLSRLRSFTQDDAHVFCRMDQAKEEFLKIWDIVHSFYRVFGFELRVRVSLHDPQHPEQYLGDEQHWKTAEDMLHEIVTSKKAESFEGIGEAAFYGPKLDFMAKDSLDREWQVATIQVDLNMPERFDLVCINEKGERERIVMLHAAIMGSIERFLSVLIEHLAGAFPLWLSPVQVDVLPVSDKFLRGAKALAEQLRASNIRTHLDETNESVGKKIRMSAKQKTPYAIVYGEEEQASGRLPVRARGKKETVDYAIDDFIALVVEKTTNRS